jgi:Uma2 family endonuclease
MAMPLTHHRFTVDEYHRMANAGILTEDDRVELLDGQIVPTSPIGPRHAGCVDDITRLFIRLAGDAVVVRVRNPVVIERYNEPEPDVVVARARPDRYRRAHPTPADVLLIVEVADTTIRQDRGFKVPLYAAAGIPEVWIVDLPADRIEVYRLPNAGAYGERQTLGREATIAPLALPDAVIGTSEILG